jgi:hypothetical protein
MSREELEVRGSYRRDRHATRPSAVAKRNRNGKPEMSDHTEQPDSDRHAGETSQPDKPSDDKDREPQNNLSPEMCDFFLQVNSAFRPEPHELRILHLACVQHDRATAARQVLDEQGTTYEDRFGQPRERPEVRIEREASRQFAQLIRQLDFPAQPFSSESDELREYLEMGLQP